MSEGRHEDDYLTGNGSDFGSARADGSSVRVSLDDEGCIVIPIWPSEPTPSVVRGVLGGADGARAELARRALVGDAEARWLMQAVTSAERSARVLDLTLLEEEPGYAEHGGTYFRAESNSGGDLDGGGLIVRDDATKEFVQMPPYAMPEPD